MSTSYDPPFMGCGGCAGTAGRSGCPVHGGTPFSAGGVLAEIPADPQEGAVNCPECKTELPPDWCGHDPITSHRECVESIAAIRDRAWQDGVNAANVREEAEIARLRSIEEAARAVTAYYDPERVEPHDSNAPLHALRAALGSER